ncbi:MAG TPA: type II toxin-antitoxin system prevent-host-death family antitoxin [Anaerolineae bacterium]|nr:type II toxin-antitoxin system prevent-host-death family antitoxin [Chloroflexota bacterium]HID50539.1 type II toxin-antitoxin system prevent-host-death family antitoxin [Anaerolineae bacterium]HIP73080.1 type II toxin-antitoxin system prevent-host-death family antitoxin [Anaerolineae bacterium]
MDTVGVRELKQQTSKILRRVREDGEVIGISYRGKTVARLVPVTPSLPSTEDMAAILANLDQLSDEISAQWPEGVSALDAVNDVRREL